ncbi:MAG: hypothetical protein ACR2M9_00005 [Cyanophyceae cyanobacterium]
MALEFSRVKLKRAEGWLIQDFTYIKSRIHKDVLHLRCSESHKGCRATAKIENGFAYELQAGHNHLPPDLPSLKFRSVLLEKAKDPTLARQSLPQIYHSEREKILAGCSNSIDRAQVLNQLPSLGTVSSSMRRSRHSELPKAPSSIDQIDNTFLSTVLDSNDNSFLLAHSQPADAHKMYVFGNREMIPHLSLAESIHLDGTFWIVPFLFFQLLTIHCFVYGQMFPIFYILLPGKTHDIYNKMFDMVFSIMAQHRTAFSSLVYVVSDFESGLIASIREKFPLQIHRGCFFHFAQAIYRKVNTLGLARPYRENADFRQAIRELIALGHVPAQFKRVYLDDIMLRFSGDARIHDFITQYFLPVWFNRYTLTIWDWYMCEVRTNNYVESFHSAIKTYFEQPHLTMYKFVLVLRDQERMSNGKFLDRIRGLPPPEPSKVYFSLNKRVMQIHGEFYSRFPRHYLAGIAACAPPRPHSFEDATG